MVEKTPRPQRVKDPDDHWDDYAKLPTPSAGSGVIIICIILIILGVLKLTGVI